MSPVHISIDLTQCPILVGGFLLGKFIAVKGSKGISDIVALKKEVIVGILEDARSVVKSFFGAPNFDSVAIVVPNAVDNKYRNEIISFVLAAGFKIMQLISENAAVAEAYADKVKPATGARLGIVSVSGGILDVSIVNIVPDKLMASAYNYILHYHKAHPEAIDFEKHESGGGLFGTVGGIVDGALQTIVLDPVEKAADILKSLLENVEIGAVDKIVLVGKARIIEKVVHIVKGAFPGVELWTGIEESEQVAAYGAAAAAFRDKTVGLITAIEDEKPAHNTIASVSV